MHANYGLVVFVAIHILNAAGLLLDWYLYAHGYMTISDRAYQTPTIGGIILVLQVIALIALTVHFWG